MDDDMELLRDYHRHGSETAFAELVRRHIHLVYSVAARHVGVAAHAVATNIRKRHLIQEEMKSSEVVKDGRAEQGGD